MNRRIREKIRADLQTRLGLLAELRENNRDGEDELLSERESDALDTGAHQAAATVLDVLMQHESSSHECALGHDVARGSA